MHAVSPPPERLTGICDRAACCARCGPFRSVRCGIMVDAMLAFRDPHPHADGYVRRRSDFVPDPSGSVEEIHACFDSALGGEAADRIARYPETHPRCGGRASP